MAKENGEGLVELQIFGVVVTREKACEEYG